MLTLQGRATMQSNLGRLEKRADRNIMKVNKGKILYLEYSSPMQRYSLWDILAERTWRSWKTKPEHESVLCPHSH